MVSARIHALAFLMVLAMVLLSKAVHRFQYPVQRNTTTKNLVVILVLLGAGLAQFFDFMFELLFHQ